MNNFYLTMVSLQSVKTTALQKNHAPLKYYITIYLQDNAIFTNCTSI